MQTILGTIDPQRLHAALTLGTVAVASFYLATTLQSYLALRDAYMFRKARGITTPRKTVLKDIALGAVPVVGMLRSIMMKQCAKSWLEYDLENSPALFNQIVGKQISIG